MSEPGEWVAGYLGRLGLPDPGRPSVRGLKALHAAQVERMPLREGTYTQGPSTFGMRRTGHGWQFWHDPAGSFAWMDFDYPRTATLADFAARHEFLSTSPESNFVRTCVVARRDATGADVLRGCVLARHGGGAAERTIDDQAGWYPR